MDIELWKILVPAGVAILVAFGSHQLAVYRQISEYRRKQKSDYLIAAFRALMLNSNNPNSDESIPALREAAIMIQFLGTQEQIYMMQIILENLLNGKPAPMDNILLSLRDDIREELKMGKVDGKIYWIHPMDILQC